MRDLCGVNAGSMRDVRNSYATPVANGSQVADCVCGKSKGRLLFLECGWPTCMHDERLQKALQRRIEIDTGTIPAEGGIAYEQVAENVLDVRLRAKGSRRDEFFYE